MHLKLYARDLRKLHGDSEQPFVGRICELQDADPAQHLDDLLLVKSDPCPWPTGYKAYLTYDETVSGVSGTYYIGPSLRYLKSGDIVRIHPKRGTVATLFRREERCNFLLVTERCDNFCLMCSQPPREIDDSWLVDELIRDVVPRIAVDTHEIGITGGEPALLGPKLISLVRILSERLPNTALHILSNGRKFSDAAFAQGLGEIRHKDLMIGIPLYSALPEEHDFVVQAKGAYDETMRGILNLKRAGVRVEIRFVTHRQTIRSLINFSRFVARNLVFVDQIVLMGLEQVGFAKANMSSLWIDPVDYQTELVEAVRILRNAAMRVAIYGHQLCVLAPELRPLAVKAISDWKNVYLDTCTECTLRDTCGGFFASSVETTSRGISQVP